MQTLPRYRLEWRIAVAAAVLATAPHASTIAQQPCNPVIDGTYCATQMPRGSTWSPQSGPMMNPISDLGRSISGEPTSPATLGGITIRGGQTCIGLLRRGACN
jgi:hypothetical protein